MPKTIGNAVTDLQSFTHITLNEKAKDLALMAAWDGSLAAKPTLPQHIEHPTNRLPSHCPKALGNEWRFMVRSSRERPVDRPPIRG